MVVAPPPTVGDVIVGSVVGGAINNAMYGGGLALADLDFRKTLVLLYNM